MEQVVRAYGRFLLELLAAAAVFGLLFYGITDDNENRGVFSVIGGELGQIGKQEEFGEDFVTYQEESKKIPPNITYLKPEALAVGEHRLSDYVKATDNSAKELPIRLLSVRDENGTALKHCNLETAEVKFEKKGIYTIEVMAKDAESRRSICKIRLAVTD